MFSSDCAPLSRTGRGGLVILFRRQYRLPDIDVAHVYGAGGQPCVLAFVEGVPDVVPVAAGGGFGIFGAAGFEEVGVLDAVQQRLQPRQRVLVHHVQRLEAELLQPPVGDVADVFFDVLGGHAAHRAHFERQIDEGVFQPHDVVAIVHDIVLHCLGQAVALGAKRVEQLDDAFAMQALVPHRP
jgi:hypothetical protein